MGCNERRLAWSMTSVAAATDQSARRSPAAEVAVEQLIARARGGDACAWRALVNRYARRVYALARSRLGDHHAAEEVSQAVFATVAAKLDSYDERGRFEPWLFRIAGNRVRDEIRRRRRRPAVSGPEVIEGLAHDSGEGATGEPSASVDVGEIRRLREALSMLSESDREVVELRHHGQLSFQQIADHVDEPLGTVLARHHRALKKLRTLMTASEETSADEADRRPA